jgi:hypothetical protein
MGKSILGRIFCAFIVCVALPSTKPTFGQRCHGGAPVAFSEVGLLEETAVSEVDLSGVAGSGADS